MGRQPDSAPQLAHLLHLATEASRQGPPAEGLGKLLHMRNRESCKARQACSARAMHTATDGDTVKKVSNEKQP